MIYRLIGFNYFQRIRPGLSTKQSLIFKHRSIWNLTGSTCKSHWGSVPVTQWTANGCWWWMACSWNRSSRYSSSLSKVTKNRALLGLTGQLQCTWEPAKDEESQACLPNHTIPICRFNKVSTLSHISWLLLQFCSKVVSNVSETGTYYIAQAGPKHSTFLCLPPKCWGQKCSPSHLLK